MSESTREWSAEVAQVDKKAVEKVTVYEFPNGKKFTEEDKR